MHKFLVSKIMVILMILVVLACKPVHKTNDQNLTSKKAEESNGGLNLVSQCGVNSDKSKNPEFNLHLDCSKVSSQECKEISATMQRILSNLPLELAKPLDAYVIVPIPDFTPTFAIESEATYDKSTLFQYTALESGYVFSENYIYISKDPIAIESYFLSAILKILLLDTVEIEVLDKIYQAVETDFGKQFIQDSLEQDREFAEKAYIKALDAFYCNEQTKNLLLKNTPNVGSVISAEAAKFESQLSLFGKSSKGKIKSSDTSNFPSLRSLPSFLNPMKTSRSEKLSPPKNPEPVLTTVPNDIGRGIDSFTSVFDNITRIEQKGDLPKLVSKNKEGVPQTIQPISSDLRQDKARLLYRRILEDPAKADAVANAFREFGNPEWINPENRQFKKLLDIVHLLGGNPDNFVHAARALNIFTKDELDKLKLIAQSVYEKEQLQIAKYRDKYPPLKPGEERKRILILKEGGGGGHLSAAQAIQAHYKSLGYDAEIIERQADEDLFLTMTAGRWSSVDFFNKVRQNRISPDGQPMTDAEVAKMGQEEAKMREAGLNYFTPTFQDRVKREGADPRVLAIIDTSPQEGYIQSAAISLGKPFLSVATDFDIRPAMARNMWKNPSNGFIALPSRNPDKELTKAIENAGKVPSANVGIHDPNVNSFWTPGGERSEELNKQLSHVKTMEESHNNPEVFASAVEATGKARIIGYPVRQGIATMEKAEKSRIRREMGVGENEKLITITFGSQGKAETLTALRAILETSLEGKTHILVLPGNNPQLSKDIEELWSSLQKTDPNISNRFSVRLPSSIPALFKDGQQPSNVLNSQQMGMVLNASNLFVTKPGGSQVAELIATRTPAITSYSNGETEAGNIIHLTQSGLGFHFKKIEDNKEEFKSKLQSMISNPPTLTPGFEPPNWKENLTKFIDETQH